VVVTPLELPVLLLPVASPGDVVVTPVELALLLLLPDV